MPPIDPTPPDSMPDPEPSRPTSVGYQLSEMESEILDHLLWAWEKFRKLPPVATTDAEAFMASIQRSQDIVLSRSRRAQLRWGT